MDIISSFTQFPLKNTSHSFCLDESFLVEWNGHMVQIHSLCGTLDRGKVPYSLLFDTTIDIETHFMWSPIWTFRICISVLYVAFLTSSGSIITSFSGKYTHSILFTSFCALKSSGVCITIFLQSLVYRRRFNAPTDTINRTLTTVTLVLVADYIYSTWKERRQLKYKPRSKLGTSTTTPKMNTERTKLIQMSISNSDRFNSFKNTWVRDDSRLVFGLGYADNAYSPFSHST